MVRRILYLHGFASSPLSRKGRAFDAYLSKRGFDVERLDLRLPNRNELRVSAMIDQVVSQLEQGGPATLIGSSLGGLVAAHVAKTREDVPALVLMAPAFRFADRWRERLGEDAFQRWKHGEALEVEDHAGGDPLRVDFGFYEDATRIDVGIPELMMPVLLLHGRHDEVVDIGVSRKLAESHGPRVTFVELDDDHSLTASIPMMLPLTLRFLEA